MKKYMILFLVFVCSLVGCSSQKESKSITFPNTNWGMTPNEVLECYGVTKDSVEYEEIEDWVTMTIPNIEVFDTKTKGVIFEFYKGNKEQFALSNVTVIYPDEQDMQSILKTVEKTYGMPQKEYKDYKSNIDTMELEQITKKETEHEKYFLDSNNLNTTLNKEEKENLKQAFAKTYPKFEDEKEWNEFLSNIPMAKLTWTDDFSYSEDMVKSMPDIYKNESKNRLLFSGIGYFIKDKYCNKDINEQVTTLTNTDNSNADYLSFALDGIEKYYRNKDLGETNNISSYFDNNVQLLLNAKIEMDSFQRKTYDLEYKDYIIEIKPFEEAKWKETDKEIKLTLQVVRTWYYSDEPTTMSEVLNVTILKQNKNNYLITDCYNKFESTTYGAIDEIFKNAQLTKSYDEIKSILKDYVNEFKQQCIKKE